MKILHLYKDYEPVRGGIENHIRDLARAQSLRGHDVSVLVTAPVPHTTESLEQGVRVVRVPCTIVVASTPLSLHWFGHIARERPDVAHLHSPYPPGELGQHWFGRSRATVLTYHSDVVRQRGMMVAYGPLFRRILQRVQLVIATSAPLIQSSPYLRGVADKTIVIPLGIVTDRFTAAPDPAALARLRAGWGGEADARPVLVTVGRLVYYKGLDTAIRAMRELDARLVVVGQGPLESDLRGLVRELGVSDRVWFATAVDDAELPAYYHAADLYVSSASQRAEAFGISIVEAMACGKPVISTELGTGTSFVNLHDSTGLVVPPSDPSALAGAARRLLASPAELRRFGEAARRRVAAEFTLEVMTKRVLAAYERALGGG